MASIILENCSLDLPIYGTINRSLKGTVMATATGGRIAPASRNVAIVQALKDINLTISGGDRVGLVGHNGSGKTSLLRMLAGIYEPTSGLIEVRGRVSSFLSLGLGIDHEATGTENILLVGLMFGLDFDDILRLTPSIEEFSGLGDFLGMPVRTYSSGMLMRLLFAIVTSVPAEIMLMDEWMSVGDAEFSKQADQRLSEMVSGASILVMASHSVETVDRHCNVIVRLVHGEIASIERRDA